MEKDSNTPRLILFFQIYFRKFWKLILINMLYVLFCLPIITIGPATAGVTKIWRNYAREEHAFIWGDFIEAFKKNFKQAFFYSLLEGFAVAFLVLDFLMIANVTNQVMKILSLAAILLTLTVIVFMHYYVYNMMVTFRLTFKQLIKNAFIFCWAGFWRNLFTTVILAAVTVAAISLNIIGVLFIMTFLYFSLCGLLINFMVNPLIKKYMIDGFDPTTGRRIEEEKYEGFENE